MRHGTTKTDWSGGPVHDAGVWVVQCGARVADGGCGWTAACGPGGAQDRVWDLRAGVGGAGASGSAEGSGEGAGDGVQAIEEGVGAERSAATVWRRFA